MMYLWIVSRTDDIGYDEYDSLIVTAESKKQALEHAGHLTCHQAAEKLLCTKIGTAAAHLSAGIVLGSFNAG